MKIRIVRVCHLCKHRRMVHHPATNTWACTWCDHVHLFPTAAAKKWRFQA